MTDSEHNPSRARDHLANERTYLAWLRAGGGIMVLGLAIAKFGNINVYTLAAGGVLIAVGVLGVIYGTSRYRRVNREIETGRFVTGSRGNGPALASTILIMAILVALALLILAGAGSPSG
jgi:putative membrane protein